MVGVIILAAYSFLVSVGLVFFFLQYLKLTKKVRKLAITDDN